MTKSILGKIAYLLVVLSLTTPAYCTSQTYTGTEDFIQLDRKGHFLCVPSSSGGTVLKIKSVNDFTEPKLEVSSVRFKLSKLSKLRKRLNEGATSSQSEGKKLRRLIKKKKLIRKCARQTQVIKEDRKQARGLLVPKFMVSEALPLISDTECKQFDLSSENQVDFADLRLLLLYWGQAVPELDFNDDGKVSAPDLKMLVTCWGELNLEDPETSPTAVPEVTPEPVPDSTETPESTPEYTPTPEPTPLPTPTVLLDFSRQAVDFGGLAIGQQAFETIVVRPLNGVPEFSGFTFTGSSEITLLDSEQTAARGGVACAGELTNFCVLVFKLDTSKEGDFEGTLSILYKESAEDTYPFAVNIDLFGSVDASSQSLNKFKTVSVRQHAAAESQTPLEYLQSNFEALTPLAFEEDDVLMFSSYSSVSDSEWKQNWFNSALDFSGIAWDRNQAGTAITHCHIVTAKHFKRTSGTIVFHRKDGTRFISSITGYVDLSGDITVSRIDPCLPEDWTVYPLVDPDDAFSGNELYGAPYINTHYSFADYLNIRRTSLTELGYIYSYRIYGRTSRTYINDFLVTATVSGDSGHPSFIVVNGKLVLVSTFSYSGTPGKGPNYMDASVQVELQNAIASLP